jgi:chromosome partitioning protein
MLKTIPVLNSKGGVGKTTTTVNVAAGLARRGKRVLVVDLDSQGSASISLGVHEDNLEPSSAQVLFGKVSIQEAIRTTSRDGIELLTGSLGLANADVRLKTDSDREHHLRSALSAVEERYDAIMIDCAPSTSILTINALMAADGVIVPVAPSHLSLKGVKTLEKVVRRTRRSFGEAAPILGMLLTMVTPNRDEKPSQKLRERYGAKVFSTEIRRDPALGEAPSEGVDIFQHAPDSQGARDYSSVVDEIEARIQQYESVFGRLASQNGGVDLPQ